MKHCSLFDLATPALILDRPRLQRNAARALEKVRMLGVPLRPHVKTSKSIDVLRVLAANEEVPITVSTLAEARYFFKHGVNDILYAVGLAPAKLPEAADLIHAGCKLRLILDSLEAADALLDFQKREGVSFEALIEIDSDGQRAGVAAQDPMLIEIGRRLGPALAGVMTHAGASYGCRTLEQFQAMADKERSSTVAAAERLRAGGFHCSIISVGSTPTMYYARTVTGATEVRAGVYAFGDLVQAELGTCDIADIAIGVLASVIGHNPRHGRILIDAGFLALSRDRGTADMPIDWGYGAVCDPVTGTLFDDLTVSSTNQEHGIITARAGPLQFDRFPVGTRVKILPNHACATTAAYDRYHVTDGGSEIIDEWERLTGW